MSKLSAWMSRVSKEIIMDEAQGGKSQGRVEYSRYSPSGGECCFAASISSGRGRSLIRSLNTFQQLNVGGKHSCKIL